MMTTKTLLLALALATAATSASAQSSTSAAEVRFLEGKIAMAKQDYKEACKAFADSFALESRPVALLMEATCYEEAGKLASAHARFERLDALMGTRTDKDATAFRNIARDHLGKLAPRLSKLIVRVGDASRVADLEVRRNGALVGEAGWNQELAVDGGEYEITAQATKRREWKTKVVIRTESHREVIDIPALAETPVPAPTPAKDPVAPPVDKVLPPPDEPVPVPRVTRSSSAAPLIIGGVAVVLGASAVGVELSGRSIYEDARAERDRPRQVQLWDQANTRRYVAAGLGAAAVVSAGVATYLYVRHRGERRTVVAPVASPDHAGVALVRAW